jgi:hypothetical protein
MCDRVRSRLPLLIGALVWPALEAGPAAALEGRYIGLWSYTDARSRDTRVLQHRYDATSQRTFREGLDGKLHVGLRYRTLPGESEAELFQSRFQGDLRGARWRLYGQLAPWQDKAAGPVPPRERYLHLGADWSFRGAARVVAEWQRRDEDSFLGRSAYEDRRVELSDVLGPYRWHAQWRRLDRGPAGSSAADHETQEWRGGLAGQHVLGPVVLQTGWQGLTSRMTLGDSRQDTDTHRLNAGGTWRAARTVTVTADGLARLGRTEATGRPARDIDERSLGAGVGWRPWTALDFRLSRDYRSREAETGRAESDYLRFEGRFRREAWRKVVFQSGYERTFDLQDEVGVPRNVAYGRLDGPIREGLEGSAELRVSESAGGVSTGRLWKRLWQLRAQPWRSTRLELTWQKDDLPRVLDVPQTDREWRLVAGFDPFRAATLTGTAVRRDGEGRIDREERFGSVAASWRPSRRSSLLVDASDRVTRVNGVESVTRIAGTDLTLWFPGETRVVGSARRSWGRGRPVTRSVSVTVEKAFP